MQRDAAVARLRVLGVRAASAAGQSSSSRRPASSARALAISALEGLEDRPRDGDRAGGARAIGRRRGRRGARRAAQLGAARKRHPSARSDHRRSPSIAAATLASAWPHSTRSPTSPTIWFVRSASRRRRRKRQVRRRTTPWRPANGSRPTAARPRWPRCTTRSRRFATRRAGRTRAAGGRSGSRRAAPLTSAWQSAAAGSRLYDARETFSSAQAPLPPGFLEAIRRLGDASCLEPLARAWSATREARLAGTARETARREIVARSKLGGRNAVVKGIRANWPGFI